MIFSFFNSLPIHSEIEGLASLNGKLYENQSRSDVYSWHLLKRARVFGPCLLAQEMESIKNKYDLECLMHSYKNVS